MAKSIRKCPICKRPVDPRGKHYPFCSERCQVIDLGNWASERYVVPAPATEADEHLRPSDGRSNQEDE